MVASYVAGPLARAGEHSAIKFRRSNSNTRASHSLSFAPPREQTRSSPLSPPPPRHSTLISLRGVVLVLVRPTLLIGHGQAERQPQQLVAVALNLSNSINSNRSIYAIRVGGESSEADARGA